MKLAEYREKRLPYLTSLKRRTEQQSLLILLASQENRSLDDEKKLNALIRADIAAMKAEKARLDAEALLRKDKQAERKARNHRLIQQGILFDLAGIQDRSRAEILGALMSLAKIDDPHKWAAWAQAGGALLAEKDRVVKSTLEMETAE